MHGEIIIAAMPKTLELNARLQVKLEHMHTCTPSPCFLTEIDIIFSATIHGQLEATVIKVIE